MKHLPWDYHISTIWNTYLDTIISVTVDAGYSDVSTSTLIMGALLERFNGFSLTSSSDIHASSSVTTRARSRPGASTSIVPWSRASPPGPANSTSGHVSSAAEINWDWIVSSVLINIELISIRGRRSSWLVMNEWVMATTRLYNSLTAVHLFYGGLAFAE